MKIRVTTSRFEYQGLYVGSEHEVESVAGGTELGDMDYYQFKHNGKMWSLSEDEVIVVDHPYQVVFDEQGGYKTYDSNGTLREERSRTGTISMYDENGVLKSRIGILDEDATQGIQPIKSDGGSSKYYDIPLPEWLTDELLSRIEAGNPYIKVEELIAVEFGNSFDFGNAYKSLHRAYQATLGGGKEGNTVDYDLRKVEYSVNKIREEDKRKNK